MHYLGPGHLGFKSLPSCKLRPVRRNLHPIYPQRRNTLRLVLAGVLVLALLWAQSLGQWHRIVHFERNQTTKLGVSPAKADNAASAAVQPDEPFSDHQSDIDCQLFDQLSHADGVPVAAMVVLGLSALAHILRASHGLAVARWHALFQARGPPPVR